MNTEKKLLFREDDKSQKKIEKNLYDNLCVQRNGF